jgi:hypothetical protein
VRHFEEVDDELPALPSMMRSPRASPVRNIVFFAAPFPNFTRQTMLDKFFTLLSA